MHGALLRFALLGIAGAGAAALCGLTPRDALASVRAIPSVLRQARPSSLMCWGGCQPRGVGHRDLTRSVGSQSS